MRLPFLSELKALAEASDSPDELILPSVAQRVITIVHDDTDQDWWMAACDIFAGLAKILEEWPADAVNPPLAEMVLDGAGNFHSAALMLWMAESKEHCGVEVKGQSYNTEGEGKRYIDCLFQSMKGVEESYCRAGGDSDNAVNSARAFNSGGMAGHTAYVLEPNRDAQPKLRDCSGALANRAGMLHFAFWTGEDGIRYITMRENAGIGVGRTISVPDAAALLTEKGSQISILEVLKSQAVSINAQLPEPAELCPAKLKDSTKKGCVPRRKGRAPKAPPLIVGGFHCTRPNCHRSFKTQHGLDEHVKGCTRDLPERYKWGMAALEQMQGGKLMRPSTSDSAYGPHSNFKPRVPLKQGWGRKGGRAKPRRFCPAAVQKLTEWFYNGMRGEGAKTKRDRITGKIAARRLIEMKLEQRPIAEDKTMFESSLAKRAQAWLVRFNSKLTKKNKSELTAKVNAELRSHMATAAIERDGLGVSEVQDATAPSDPTQLQVEQANSAEVHERPAKTAKLSKCHGSSDHHAAARTLQPVSGAFVGRKVKKMFDDGVVYEGTVTEFHNDAVYVSGGRVQCGGVVYSVVYEDGDREDLEPDELLPFLVREL